MCGTDNPHCYLTSICHKDLLRLAWRLKSGLAFHRTACDACRPLSRKCHLAKFWRFGVQKLTLWARYSSGGASVQSSLLIKRRLKISSSINQKPQFNQKKNWLNSNWRTIVDSHKESRTQSWKRELNPSPPRFSTHYRIELNKNLSKKCKLRKPFLGGVGLRREERSRRGSEHRVPTVI